MSAKTSGAKVKQISNLATAELLELEHLEKKVFGEAALNRWTLPIIARYGNLFLLTINDQTAGVASFMSKQRQAFLVGFWVKAEFRGQGMGEFFLGECLEALVKKNTSTVEVTVSVENKPAHSLYKKTGFKLVEKISDFYGPGETRLLLQLNLLK